MQIRQDHNTKVLTYTSGINQGIANTMTIRMEIFISYQYKDTNTQTPLVLLKQGHNQLVQLLYGAKMVMSLL